MKIAIVDAMLEWMDREDLSILEVAMHLKTTSNRVRAALLGFDWDPDLREISRIEVAIDKDIFVVPRNEKYKDDMVELRKCRHCGAEAERITDFAKSGKNTEMVRCSNVSGCDEWTVVGGKTRQEADENWNSLHTPADNPEEAKLLPDCRRAMGWVSVAGFCATRVTPHGQRVAFIEKTPRVLHPERGEWIQGPKGRGGSGDPQEENLYGFYSPSRRWCDQKLEELGYDIIESTAESNE